MSRKAIVHIGVGKTGSSAIQTTLFAARQHLLSDEQILYPSIEANHSIYLGTIFRDTIPPTLTLMKSNLIDSNSIDRTRKNFLASLETDLNRRDWNRVVISAESLSSFTPEAISRFIEWLTRHVSDVSIVAYVRHPVDWIRSMVQQHLKAGNTLEMLYENLPAPNWRKRFAPWLEAVGRERFHLVSFDEARKNEGIVATFCDAAGLPREKILSFAPAAPVNESMSREAVLLLDSLNRQRPLFKDGKVSPERRWRGTNVIKSIPGGKFRLSGEHEAKIRSRSRPDLEWLNRTFGVDLYPDIFDDPPDEAATRPETIPQETIDALALTLSRYGNRIKQLEKQAERLEGKLAKDKEEKETRKKKWFFTRP